MSIEMRLTDEADYMLCVLYDAYKLRRKNGESSLEARLFGDSEYIQENYIQQWPTDDIDDAARELSQKGLASGLFADNTLAEFALERDGITFTAQLDTKVFQARIRSGVAVAEAPAHGESVLTYAPDSKVARDFRLLLNEVTREYGSFPPIPTR